MAQLIEDLLAFSRWGRAELCGSRVDVGGLVAEIVGQVREQDPGRAVFFQVGTLPEVAADPAMLRVALTNLLANAMKYTRKRPRAEIEIGQRNDGEDYVVIFVRDNGAGFDMQYADRLFGVFQRLHRDDEFEGTGIGLATVRRIVHRHGGQVWAEGELDRGAMFSFSMPRWSAAAPGTAAKV
jgi:light-regulated signal transduction histidine kinase (bacteriophytochrome)